MDNDLNLAYIFTEMSNWFDMSNMKLILNY